MIQHTTTFLRKMRPIAVLFAVALEVDLQKLSILIGAISVTQHTISHFSLVPLLHPWKCVMYYHVTQFKLWAISRIVPPKILILKIVLL